MARLITDLTTRVVIITLITSIVSYLVVQKRPPYQLAIAIPLLFVTFGTVIMINVLFDLWRYRVVSAIPVKVKIGFLDRTRLITHLTARIVIITSIYAIISYLVVQRNYQLDQLAIGIPVLLVMFGIVIMISILFVLWRYHVMDAVPTKK
jgi:hypothetical protein